MGIANYVTMMNLSAGFMAILLASYDYRISLILIYVSFLADTFDGKLARMLNESSEIGKQMDSFSDLVSFGIAPAFIIFTMTPTTPLIYIISTFYVLCTMYRLARYNIETTGPITYFQGLPSIYSALLIITLLWFVPPEYMLYSLVIFGLLMISRIRIPKIL